MSRWLRCVLAANGVPDGLPIEDAWAVAAMLVVTRRAPPMNTWVDSANRRADLAAVQNFTSWR